MVEASIEGADDAFLEQIQIRHDRDWLRISFPQQFFRYTKAELRLDVPDGLDYAIKTGSADISISAEIGRSKIVSGSGDITLGNATDLDCSAGSGRHFGCSDGRQWQPGPDRLGRRVIGRSERPHHRKVGVRRQSW